MLCRGNEQTGGRHQQRFRTENIYTKAHGLTKKGDDPASPNRFYRFLYIRVAHRYWMKEVNKFGLKRRDVVKYHGKYVFDD